MKVRRQADNGRQRLFRSIRCFPSVATLLLGVLTVYHYRNAIMMNSCSSISRVLFHDEKSIKTQRGTTERQELHLLLDDNSSSTRTIDSIMARLSSESTFLPTVDYLYNKYGHEIASYRPTMRQWCQKTRSCKFCDQEVEMMYMLIREIKPARVFEMAPNRGYTSHWILKALQLNDNETKPQQQQQQSLLYSYDIHDTSVKWMQAPGHEERWKFIMGDYRELLESGELVMKDFDFIFIDALHTEEFSRGYCQKLLAPYNETKAIVAIHDIVADRRGGGRESSEVYKYLAYFKNANNLFTMSRFTMPSLAFPLDNGVGHVNRIRALQGIVEPCEPESICNSPLHGHLYFENGDSPTLFFQLN